MRSVRLALGSVTLAAVAAISGCGGDSAAACANITAEIQNITNQGLKQISDPQGMAKTYSDGAAKIRAEGAKAGGDVETAAADVAAAMDGLGKSVGSGSTQIPDTAPLINAGAKLKAACS